MKGAGTKPRRPSVLAKRARRGEFQIAPPRRVFEDLARGAGEGRQQLKEIARRAFE
jgi:hypothetical protein